MCMNKKTKPIVICFVIVGLLLSSSMAVGDEETNLGNTEITLPRDLRSDDLCMLCEEGINEILWPLSVIESDGTTCTSKAVQMAMGFRPNTGRCNQQIEAYRETCCSGTPPKQVDYVPPNPSANVEKIGPHPICPVCYGGDYPSETSMVLSVLYMGSGSCAEFEKIGRQGLIPAHLCDPIQHFGHEPCGCGEFNQNLIAQNLPAPTQREYIPPSPESTNVGFRGSSITTASPTKQPTPSPTNSPTLRPTLRPTPTPTKSPTLSPTSRFIPAPTPSPATTLASFLGISPTPAPGPENYGTVVTLSSIWDGDTATTQQRQAPDPDGKEATPTLHDSDRGGAGGVRRTLKGSSSNRM